MPSSAIRSGAFVAGVVSSRGARSGATTRAGCGSKVRTEGFQPALAPQCAATRRRMRRCPACTPSKLPMVSADGPEIRRRPPPGCGMILMPPGSPARRRPAARAPAACSRCARGSRSWQMCVKKARCGVSSSTYWPERAPPSCGWGAAGAAARPETARPGRAAIRARPPGCRCGR